MNERQENMRSRGHGILWIACGAALWGTDTVFRRSLTESLDPARIVLYEHVILSLIVLPILIRGRHYLPKIPSRTWLTLFAISWIGSAIATVFFTAAIRAGNPTTAVLLQKTQPIFAILLARVVTNERWPSSFPLLATIAVAGGYLVAFGDGNLLRPLRSVELFPALLAICAAIGWAFATVWGRLVSKSLPFELITALRVVCALPLLIALTFFQQALSLPSGKNLLSLTWIALVPGFAGLMMYYRGLRHTPASRATIAELAFPMTASLLNWIVLGAPTSWIQLAGFGIVWSAILSLSAL
jgi:drug/metabolite transporter (DMT)-like permease